jgi:predicted PurR-regulated permease PerM
MRSAALMFLSPWHNQAWENLLPCMKTGANPFEHAHGLPAFEWLEQHEVDFASLVSEAAQKGSTWIVRVIRQTSQTTLSLLVSVAIMLFTLFFFFRDGHEILNRLMQLSPLPDKYERRLWTRFVEVSLATVRGTLLLGLVQGTLGAITLAAVGVGGVMIWWVVMVILSVIPMVGGWLVMYPAALTLLLGGEILKAIIVVLVTSVVIGNIDNLLRPRLVGAHAKMHDLLILFSTIGGISMFGLLGFIIGPILAALLLTLLEIYSIEFHGQLPQTVAAENSEEKPGDGEHSSSNE